MNWIYSRVTTGIGIGASAVGCALGVATTVTAVIFGAPVAVVGISVAAPVACAYNVMVGKGSLDAQKQIERLDTTSLELQQTEQSLRQELDHMKNNNVKQQTQLEQGDEQLRARDEQIERQEAEIQKLWDLHGKLRKALADLAVAGDTFTQFAPVLQNSATKIETTADRLDQTAALLEKLSASLDAHISQDRELTRARALFAVDF